VEAGVGGGGGGDQSTKNKILEKKVTTSVGGEANPHNSKKGNTIGKRWGPTPAQRFPVQKWCLRIANGDAKQNKC